MEKHMLTVGNKFPNFELTGVVGNTQEDFITINNETYKDKWLVIFFYPKDFTFICPTEIVGFNKLNKDFTSKNAQLLGGSIDSEFVHLAWRNSHSELKNLEFPLISDIKRELSNALGILDYSAGVSQRATFIVDPQGIIRFVEVTDMNVGRNPYETLRVLDALQEKGLCPCSWKKGEDTIKV